MNLGFSNFNTSIVVNEPSADYYTQFLLLPFFIHLYIVFGNVILGFRASTYRDPIGYIALAHGMKEMAIERKE